MIRKLDYFLLEEGYGKLQTQGKESTIYYQYQNQFMNVIHVMYIPSGFPIDSINYINIKRSLISQFHEKGFPDVHILTIVLSENVEAMEPLVKEDMFSWVIDKEKKALVIPKDHIEDFYGMKKMILSSLDTSEPFGEQEEETNVKSEKVKIPFVQQSFFNYGIVALNVVLFLLCMVFGDELYSTGMLYPLQVVEQGKWYQLISSMFLHEDVNHVFGNMIILFLLGNIAEKHFGHLKYFFIYMTTGIVGNLFSIEYSYIQQDFVPSLGASGAVYGIVGAFLWILIRNKGKMEDITITRYIFVFAYSLHWGFTSIDTDNIAHVGGLLVGFLLGILLYRKKKEGNI